MKKSLLIYTQANLINTYLLSSELTNNYDSVWELKTNEFRASTRMIFIIINWNMMKHCNIIFYTIFNLKFIILDLYLTQNLSIYYKNAISLCQNTYHLFFVNPDIRLKIEEQLLMIFSSHFSSRVYKFCR